MKIWFSKYAVRSFTDCAMSTRSLASATLRPSGFSQITPFSPAPRLAASTTASTIGTRAKLGAQTATQSTCCAIS